MRGPIKRAGLSNVLQVLEGCYKGFTIAFRQRCIGLNGRPKCIETFTTAVKRQENALSKWYLMMTVHLSEIIVNVDGTSFDNAKVPT